MSDAIIVRAGNVTKSYIDTSLGLKVDKVEGKGLSTNDYDSLQEIRAFDYVLDEITKNNKDEIPKLELLLYETIREQKETYNSLSAMISKKLDEIIKVIPDKNEWSKILKNTVKILNKSTPEVIQAFSKELLNGNLLSILRKNKSEKLNTKKVNISREGKADLSLDVLDKN